MIFRSRLLMATCVVACVSPSLARADGTVPADYRRVTVDASDVSGTIRSLQGFDGSAQPLFPGYPDLHLQFTVVNVDFVRMHDFFGIGETDSSFPVNAGALANADDLGHPGPTEAAAAQVIQDYASPRVIFPNPNADPDDPRSYNFTATDAYVRDIAKNGRKVLFRFGRSQNVGGLLPSDFAKYADVSKHIVMHYDRGWDKGMIGAVQYYEVWNEPDLGPLQWAGSAAQYYDFYSQIALAVKAAAPEVFIGGPVTVSAADPGNDYVLGFIRYVASNNIPLDFFAWHHYAPFSLDPYDYFRIGKSTREVLDQYGLQKTQQFVTEWNSINNAATGTALTQTPYQAAFVASAIAYMQDGAIDRAFYYRGDALYLGMFSKGGNFTPTAAAFAALGQLNATPLRLRTVGQDTIGYTVLAGKSEDSKEIRILISNYQRDANYPSEPPPAIEEAALSLNVPASSSAALPYFGFKPPSLVQNLNPSEYTTGLTIPPQLAPQVFNYANNQGYDLLVEHLPWGARPFTVTRYRIDSSHNLDLVDVTYGEGGQVQVTAAIPPPSVEFVVIREIQ